MADLFSFPLESALLPGVDKPDYQHKNIGRHDDEGARNHLPKNKGPGEKEDDLDIKKQENEGDQIELDRERVDVLPQVRAAALKGFVFGRVWPRRPQDPIHENQDKTQQTEDRKDQKGFDHVVFSE
jgi:hypothetical protein